LAIRKADSKSIIGIEGVRDILTGLYENGYRIPSVCIGGINASNIPQVIYKSSTIYNKLDGVAVVSAIMTHKEPEKAAAELKQLIKTPPPFLSLKGYTTELSAASIRADVLGLMGAVVTQKPLCHNMTNTVVQNMAANIAIAIGGSPIMSNIGDEAADLAKLGGSLVVNMGTATPEQLKNQIVATTAYNAAGRPVLFDPVGAGATTVRRQAVKSLMANGYFDVIKGNEGEIKTVAGTSSAVQQRGVDSGVSTLSVDQKAIIVEELARRERCIVVMSGAVDIVSDGNRTVFISNGHELMGLVTGSGCSMGTTIAAFLAVNKGDKLVATVAAILLYTIAAELAAAEEHVHGPGSFLPEWIDQLYKLSRESAEGKATWRYRARVECRQVFL
jgi:thiamine-phosphate diphosphorylase/hydroxyethylthiazole kinase